MARRIGTEARQIDDRIVRRKALQLLCLWSHKQGTDEQVVPGKFVDHADVDPMFGLRSAKQVSDEQGFALGDFGKEIGLEQRKMVGRHCDIGLAPPDTVLGFCVPDDELVRSGTARVLAGRYDKSAISGKQAFTA